jgi:hypothetical protein
MANPVFFRVKAVAGYHVVDAVNLNVTHRIVGHTKTKTGETQVFGKKDKQPVYSFTVSPEADLVAETRDAHIRENILGGALDYVETVVGTGANAKTHRDPALVAATTANMLKRAKAAAAHAASAAALDASDKARLAAADADRTKAEAAIAAMSGAPAPAPIPVVPPAPEADPSIPVADSTSEG